MYKITDYTKNKAKELGVTVKPSKNKNKKIDVYRKNEKLASIGSMKYIKNDYPTYIINKGKQYADERRRLYKKRHSKDLKVKDSPGYYADKLLW
jgi:hypothetical protein